MGWAGEEIPLLLFFFTSHAVSLGLEDGFGRLDGMRGVINVLLVWHVCCCSFATRFA